MQIFLFVKQKKLGWTPFRDTFSRFALISRENRSKQSNWRNDLVETSFFWLNFQSIWYKGFVSKLFSSVSGFKFH